MYIFVYMYVLYVYVSEYIYLVSLMDSESGRIGRSVDHGANLGIEICGQIARMQTLA
jgi:hypothetical protein